MSRALFVRRYLPTIVPTLADYHDVIPSAVETVDAPIERRNAFARLRFRTSGSQLRIGYWADFASNAWLTVVVDGVFNQRVTLTTDGAEHTTDISLPAGDAKVIDIWEGPQFAYEPSVNTGGVVTSLEMLDRPGYLNAPEAPAWRVVVYGDSITQGATGYPDESWIGLLRLDAAFTGQITSYGSGGRSLYRDSVAQGVATVAGILAEGLADVEDGGTEDLIVAMGTNDWGLEEDGGVATFQTNIAALVDAVHASRSSATVHLVSPIDRNGEATPNANGDTLQDYRDAMQAVALTRGPWCVYHDASAVIDQSTYTSDGVHPTAAGYELIKAWVLSTVLA
jgi:lysophospholipase L1-like esterase